MWTLVHWDIHWRMEIITDWRSHRTSAGICKLVQCAVMCPPKVPIKSTRKERLTLGCARRGNATFGSICNYKRINHNSIRFPIFQLLLIFCQYLTPSQEEGHESKLLLLLLPLILLCQAERSGLDNSGPKILYLCPLSSYRSHLTDRYRIVDRRQRVSDVIWTEVDPI